jgi:hypothetical protein
MFYAWLIESREQRHGRIQSQLSTDFAAMITGARKRSYKYFFEANKYKAYHYTTKAWQSLGAVERVAIIQQGNHPPWYMKG